MGPLGWAGLGAGIAILAGSCRWHVREARALCGRSGRPNPSNLGEASVSVGRGTATPDANKGRRSFGFGFGIDDWMSAEPEGE